MLYNKVLVYEYRAAQPQPKGNKMYGLNDPASPNYIADIAERVKTLAELQLASQENSMTIDELIAFFNECGN